MLRQPCLVCGRVPSDPHTSPLPNRARWAAKQATSSPSRSAEPTTGSSIARVMSWHGGAGSTLTRFQWRSSFGSRAERMANSSRRPQELRRHGRQRQRLAQRRLDQARPLIQTPSRKARASRPIACQDCSRGTSSLKGSAYIWLGIEFIPAVTAAVGDNHVCQGIPDKRLMLIPFLRLHRGKAFSI
jgi:hypothetical protein